MDLQSIVIDGNRHKLRAVCAQHLPRRGIARLLKANPISRLESRQRQQPERLRGAGGDDEVLRSTGNSPRTPEVGGQLSAQLRVAGKRPIAAWRALLPDPLPDALPDVLRERLNSRCTQPKQNSSRLWRSPEHLFSRRSLTRMQPARHSRSANGDWLERARNSWEALLHIGSRTGAPNKVALGEELLVGLYHTIARNAQRRRDRARRGETHPRPQQSLADGVPQLFGDLHMQWCPTALQAQG